MREKGKEKRKHKKRQEVQKSPGDFLKNSAEVPHSTEAETSEWGDDSEVISHERAGGSCQEEFPSLDRQTEEHHTPDVCSTRGTQGSHTCETEQERTITNRMGRADRKFFQALVKLAAKMSEDEEATLLTNVALSNFTKMKEIALEQLMSCIHFEAK